MSTRGWEDITAEDLKRMSRRPETGRQGPNGPKTDSAEPHNSEGPTGQPRAITGSVAKKGHKYRAEPCIVTPDFTLFTKADIKRLRESREKPFRNCSEDLPPPKRGEFVRRVVRTYMPVTGPSLKKSAAEFGIIGEWFGSTKEGRRWIELRQLEMAGEIQNLERQPRFVLRASGLDYVQIGVGEYRADFRYFVGTKEVVEDVKGLTTPVYRLKKKIVEACYGITILET